MTTTRHQVPQMILAQIGPMALASTGARQFVGDGTGVHFQINGRGVDKIEVKLAADDTYTVRRFKMSRTYQVTRDESLSNIYADNLAETVLSLAGS